MKSRIFICYFLAISFNTEMIFAMDQSPVTGVEVESYLQAQEIINKIGQVCIKAFCRCNQQIKAWLADPEVYETLYEISICFGLFSAVAVALYVVGNYAWPVCQVEYDELWNRMTYGSVGTYCGITHCRLEEMIQRLIHLFANYTGV